MKKNQVIHALTIDSMAKKGQFLAYHQGASVLLPEVIPGEKVKAKVLKSGDAFNFAKVLSIISPSDKRKLPRCVHFGICGGCHFQHIDYQMQVDLKARHFKQSLAHLQDQSEIVYETLACEEGYGYRYKSQFDVWFEDDSIHFGLNAARSSDAVALSHCPISDPSFFIILNYIRDYIEELKVSHPDHFHDIWQHFCHIQLKKAYNQNGIMLVFVFSTSLNNQASSDDAPSLDGSSPIIKALSQCVAYLTRRCHGIDIVSAWLNVNAKSRWVNTSDSFYHIWGTKTLTDSLLGVNLNLSPGSFMQANGLLIERVWTCIKQHLSITKQDTLLDIYSGTCGLSLYLAQSFKHVVCVESSPSSSKDAVLNLNLNKSRNVKLINLDASEAMSKLIDTQGDDYLPETIDMVLVDPPRSGLKPDVIQGIVALKPTKIVYMSCQLESLKRDLAVFSNQGYQVKKAVMVDMFAQTYHIESIIFLEISSH